MQQYFFVFLILKNATEIMSNAKGIFIPKFRFLFSFHSLIQLMIYVYLLTYVCGLILSKIFTLFVDSSAFCILLYDRYKSIIWNLFLDFGGADAIKIRRRFIKTTTHLHYYTMSHFLSSHKIIERL